MLLKMVPPVGQQKTAPFIYPWINKFYFVSTATTIWPGAATACTDMGAILATVESTADDTATTVQMKKETALHL